MPTYITVPKPGTQTGAQRAAARLAAHIAASARPEKDTPSRQVNRRDAMKVAKSIARDDPKKVGLRRGDWRKVFS